MERDATPYKAPPLTDIQLWGTEVPAAPPEAEDLDLVCLTVCPFTGINCSAWEPGTGCLLGGCGAMML